MLAVVGRRAPARLRVFLLTVAVVDDVIALIVIATAYTEELAPLALLIGAGLLVAVMIVRSLGVQRGLPYAVLGVAAWVAVLESGVDPVIVGLAMGLITSAYPAPRADLEQATRLFRAFREQPTSELAREARLGLQFSISPNERLQQMFHPWTSYVVVPLFALANTGIAIDADFLRRAATSPITIGIIVGYVVGKPIGIVCRAVAGREARPRAPAAAGRLADAGGRRRDRRHRVHGRAADRRPRVRGRAAGGGQGGRAGGCGVLGDRRVGAVPGRRAAPRRAARRVSSQPPPSR